MSVNASSTFDYLIYHCHKSKAKPYIIMGYFAVKTLFILPLCIFILHLGHLQWRQHRSFDTASHSDLFTYHVSTMELLWVIGSVFFLYGDNTKILVFIQFGMFLTMITFYGELCFHILTCVERYLAVIHPVTYLGLRNARGVRIRNISIGCVWLICLAMLPFHADLEHNTSRFALLCFMPLALIIIFFCSLSVLLALIRPGPGERGREKERIHQSKQRAFHTMAAISGVLWFWFLGILVATALNASPNLDDNIGCTVSASINWLNLPCSLVLPLQYLHRAGKLSCRFK